MKIGIESQRIFRAAKHGMEVVAVELIRNIQRLDSVNDYFLFAKNGPDRNCVSDTANFHTEITPGNSYPWWEQVSLPAALKKMRPDLIHCTANTAPLSSGTPLILTVHDVIYLEGSDFNGSAYQNFGNIYRRMVVPPAIKKAKAIITVSEYEKRQIIKTCKVDPAKITVIYNGVDKRFHPDHPAEEISSFRKQYGLPENFILFLGNTAPKKNTEAVITAYVHYCYIEPSCLPIVITDYGKKHVVRILKELNKPALIGKFIFPGYVPTAKMPLLYNSSSLFLYPSLRESFGLPILEAMASGVPVITSDTSAMPEIAGDAAILVDPYDVEEIAHAMRHILLSTTPREQMIQKGITRAGQFSWATAAEKLLAVYQR
jgi:glycosyltransferase involved in cell wall biosynthesis